MNINGQHYRTIWTEGEFGAEHLKIIDQTLLPHIFRVVELQSFEDILNGIKTMQVRGAGLIGATAAYGCWMAAREASTDAFAESMERSLNILVKARPTASNLAWAVARQKKVIVGLNKNQAVRALFREAQLIADEDAEFCRRIGEYGMALFQTVAARKGGEPVQILTHCNAGWLAFTDYGSALSPVYAAFDAGIPIHVWVDETRPRNQGASLSAWELGMHGVPHDVIVDNAGGHLMQHGMVDLVIVGADRVTRCGDAANKIGTYLKALAAKDNGIPFYVALPSSTFDFSLRDGVREIPIEERNAGEVREMVGMTSSGDVKGVRICPESSPARNWAFDVTPARLITGFITERGICEASEEGILSLFPEKR